MPSGRKAVLGHGFDRSDERVNAGVIMRARDIVHGVQYYVEHAGRLRDRDDWPEVVAHLGLVRFWRDKVLKVVGGQSEDLGGMDVEEHAIGREEDKVWGNGKECRAWVEGGRDRDDGITWEMVLGQAVGEIWGSMRRLVGALEGRDCKLAELVSAREERDVQEG